MTTIDRTALSLEISRYFAASPERVFDAWLDKRWGEWLPPKAARCEIASIEPVVGGAYLVRMTMADGRDIEISGKYKEITRPTKLVLTWTGNYNKQEMLITVTFRADGEGTLMTLRQDGFTDPAMRDGYDAGWSKEGGSFDKLSRFLMA
jgi:uncharacterized protein YndB with AHSA1/START domain